MISFYPHAVQSLPPVYPIKHQIRHKSYIAFSTWDYKSKDPLFIKLHGGFSQSVQAALTNLPCLLIMGLHITERG